MASDSDGSNRDGAEGAYRPPRVIFRQPEFFRTGFARLDCPTLVGAEEGCGSMVGEAALKAWFCREILPLEASLTRFIRRNWRNESEVADLRQEVYARVYEGARNALPLQPRAFLFATARNHLINCAKRAQIVSFDTVADLEALNVAADVLTPERHLTAREELRRLEAGLRQLPPRCRQVVMLRKIEGLSQREAAQQMGVSEDTVEHQMVFGMRALVDFMLGGSGRIKRGAAARKPAAKEKLS